MIALLGVALAIAAMQSPVNVVNASAEMESWATIEGYACLPNGSVIKFGPIRYWERLVSVTERGGVWEPAEEVKLPIPLSEEV